MRKTPIAKPELVARIRLLVAKYGTYSAAGKAIGITGARLQQISDHPEDRIGAKVLAALGYIEEPPRYRQVENNIK